MRFKDNTIIGQIAEGKYPEKDVETKYGVFTLKYPSGKDHMVMNRKKAAYFSGMPSDSFDVDAKFRAELDSVLDVSISKYPDKFPDKWKYEEIIDFPDLEVKNALYKAFLEFLKGTQKSISETK